MFPFSSSKPCWLPTRDRIPADGLVPDVFPPDTCHLKAIQAAIGGGVKNTEVIRMIGKRDPDALRSRLGGTYDTAFCPTCSHSLPFRSLSPSISSHTPY